MNKINPIKILNLQKVNNITLETIKDAKRNFKALYGLAPEDYDFTWPDAEAAIDALSLNDIKMFKEKTNNPIVKFIETGVFTADLNKPIRVSKSLLNNVKEDLNKTLSQVLLEEFIANEYTIINSLTYLDDVADENEYFKGIVGHLHHQKDNYVKDPTTNIVSKLNRLPDYFEDDISKIAMGIRLKGINAWNNDNKFDIGLGFIKLAYSLNSNETTKNKLKGDIDDFNDIKKDSSCHFCGAENPKGISYSVMMFKETARTYYPRSVNWLERTIEVPRCRNCVREHGSDSQQGLFLAMLGIAAGVLLGLMSEEAAIGIGAATILAVIGAAVGSGKDRANEEAKKGKPATHYKYHNRIKEAQKEKFTFKQPTP